MPIVNCTNASSASSSSTKLFQQELLQNDTKRIHVTGTLIVHLLHCGTDKLSLSIVRFILFLITL